MRKTIAVIFVTLNLIAVPAVASAASWSSGPTHVPMPATHVLAASWSS